MAFSAFPKVVNVLRWPLPLRVLLGVIVGATLGLIFKKDPIIFGWTNADAGRYAALYVQTLTALATPLIFFAILDAFVQTHITGRQGLRMFCICAINVAAAFAVGLTILNVFEPGAAWRDRFASVAETLQEADSGTPPGGGSDKIVAATNEVSLSLYEFLKRNTPSSIAEPFLENMILTVAVLSILIGAAMRSLKASEEPPILTALTTFEHLVTIGFQIVMKLLLWMIELAPIAICFAVFSVVGESGAKTFEMVAVFLVTVVCGLGIHSLIYYPLSAWLIGGKSPFVYFGEGGGAILTGLSLNSSLATAPLTLQALKRMEVSDSAARLSACVGTNFNNDGVTLYEAMTALFIAQAIGFDMSIGEQITILLAALIGSMGIAGIPNSGLIILALVLKSANLPDSAIQIGIPMVYSIDFIIARLRSAVNVMGDLQVAILLDASGRGRNTPPETSSLISETDL